MFFGLGFFFCLFVNTMIRIDCSHIEEDVRYDSTACTSPNWTLEPFRAPPNFRLPIVLLQMDRQRLKRISSRKINLGIL